MGRSARKRLKRDAAKIERGLQPRTTVAQRRVGRSANVRVVTVTEKDNRREVVLTRSGVWLPPGVQ